MGTKKGQRRKTARRAYRATTQGTTEQSASRPLRIVRRRKRAWPTKRASQARVQDWARYQLYLGRKEKQREKAGAGAFEMGPWVPYDFKTWFAGWGRR